MEHHEANQPSGIGYGAEGCSSDLSSPDGKWRWDGAVWRQLSDDRMWWWDGGTWAPTGSSEAHESEGSIPGRVAQPNQVNARFVRYLRKIPGFGGDRWYFALFASAVYGFGILGLSVGLTGWNLGSAAFYAGWILVAAIVGAMIARLHLRERIGGWRTRRAAERGPQRVALAQRRQKEHELKAQRQAALRAEREASGQRAADDAARRPRVEVVRYTNTRNYERDAQRRIAAGWRIEAQTQETGRTRRLNRSFNGAFIGGLFGDPIIGGIIGGLSGKRDQGPITVTWKKDSEMTAQVASPSASAGPVSSSDPQEREVGSGMVADAIDQLRRLAELKDSGVITPEEFDAKKAALLGRI